MRLILTILLIGLFQAEGQIVINASAPYRPYAQPAAKFLLDDYPNAAAAYSLRKLDKDYTGAAIRVRKDTTGQPEQDIGFTASGDLDTAAIKSFLNARSGFVTTWYDQSGSSQNATQTVQANQPRIANLGVIDRQGTRPTTLYDGSNDHLTFTAIAASNTTSLYYVQKRNAAGNPGAMLSGSQTGGASLTLAQWTDNNIYWQYLVSGSGKYRSVADATSDFILLEGYNNTTPSQKVFKNNTELTLSSELSFTATQTNWNQIGRYGSTHTNGRLSELILYNSDQLSNRSGIATNINLYYSIY